jgi:hypothetical protein
MLPWHEVPVRYVFFLFFVFADELTRMLRGQRTNTMLRGCWLLTDLDGTLVSTPHKAHGQYLSVAEGPCFGALQKWLAWGGNICVITTADRRVFQQVHVPLQSNTKTVDESVPSREAEGQLLLSMCTGAVLYQSTPAGVCLEPSYLAFPHTNLGEPIPLSSSPEPPATAATCLDRQRCQALHDIMIDIFLHYARDVLFEVPEALESQSCLSKRYRLMWSKLLHYLAGKFQMDQARQAAEHEIKSKRGVGSVATASPTSEMLWKYNYLRTHDKLINKVGIVRKEYISAIPATLRSPEDAVNTSSAPPTPPVPAAPVKEEITFISFLQNLLGVDTSAPQEDAAHTSAPTTASSYSPRQRLVAQMILVGIPMKAFDKYFGPYAQVFDSLGVSVISQPNSVVFSRRGIDKSSTVRYLDEAHSPQGGWMPSSITACKSSCYPANAVVGRVVFANSVNLRKCVALGDNPHSADHQLTVFPQLRFVSVEKHEQRRRRHDDIDKAGGVGTAKGHLMDDRSISHLHYVGGEEDGTNAFLLELMEEIQRLHEVRIDVARGASNTAAPTGALAVHEDTFQLALTNASKRAAQVAKRFDPAPSTDGAVRPALQSSL